MTIHSFEIVSVPVSDQQRAKHRAHEDEPHEAGHRDSPS